VLACLHLKDFRRKSIGMMSIGGAGIDGIVLSGIVAACFA
jgi:uncharacterized membrane protein